MSAGLSVRIARHRVDLVRTTRTPTGKGGNTVTVEDIATSIPAEVLGVTGSEAVREKLLGGIRVYRVTLRYREDVQLTDQLRLAGGQIVNIRSAVDEKGTRRELVIHADSEGVVP